MQGAGESISDADFVNTNQAAAAEEGAAAEEQQPAVVVDEEEKKEIASGEAVEPNLGDLGIIESESRRAFDGNYVDDEMISQIRAEKANLNVRDSQLEELMDKASVKLTEEQMREAEQHYKQIDEGRVDGVENVNEEGEGANNGQEEEKKEDGQTIEDQPTQLAKKLNLNKQQRS